MNQAVLLHSAKAAHPAIESLYGPLRGLGTFAITALGTVLGGMLGSITYPSPPGVGAIGGCFAGFLVGLVIGCLATGFLWELMSEKLKPATLNIRTAIPHSMAVQIGSHGAFELVLTVHQVSGIHVQGALPWQRPDQYVEIECGSNPVRRTVVKPNGVFEQQFKIKVAPTDEFIALRLMDQDIFGSSSIGFCCVDVLKDIIMSDFPKKVRFDLEASDTDRLKHVEGVKACILLSFDITDKYPERLRPEREAEAVSSKKADYGSVAFLSDKLFTHKKSGMARSGPQV